MSWVSTDAKTELTVSVPAFSSLAKILGSPRDPPQPRLQLLPNPLYTAVRKTHRFSASCYTLKLGCRMDRRRVSANASPQLIDSQRQLWKRNHPCAMLSDKVHSVLISHAADAAQIGDCH